MKIKYIAFILPIILMVNWFSYTSAAADSMFVRKVVSVVYDDSGSMSSNGSMNWSYANYAMQTLCGLLNSEDELYITYMSSPDTAVMPVDFSSNRQTAVDNIRSMSASGNTPQSAIITAQNKLVEIYNRNRPDSTKTEYWLVVISDGEFNEKGVFGQTELDSALQSFSASQINDGMDLHTVYLAIGSNAVEAAGVPELNIIAKKSDDGKAIVSILSDLSNDVSGRYRISQDGIILVNDNTVEVTSGIPLANIAILMQNSSATLISITCEDNSVLPIILQVNLQYPENDGWTTDTNLNGKSFLVGNTGQNIQSGKYTLVFSDKVDINALDIMVEPSLELHLSVLKNGVEIDDVQSLQEGDTVDLQMTLRESGTDKNVDVSLLGGGVDYNVGYSENDLVVKTSDSMTLSGITLHAAKTEFFGTLTFGNFLPLTSALETFPAVPAAAESSVPVQTEQTTPPPPAETIPSPTPIQTDYGLIVVNPDGLTIDRDDLAVNTDIILFAITRGGLLLTKEETGNLPFQISLDTNIPYFLEQRDDGVYTFRPLPKWPPLLYPTGTFTVTGILNNTITQSGVFVITSEHLFLDVITLIWPLFVLAFFIFYLTRKRFVKSYITRKVYYISADSAREGSQNHVFVGPFTGWWQLLNHSCKQKFGYLTFTAARKGTASVKSSYQKPLDYRSAALSANPDDIRNIFYGRQWMLGMDMDKSIRISETNALYIKSVNSIAVYYIRRWQKRSRNRSKTNEAFLKKDNIMYMYEQGDKKVSYDSAAELRKAALGIVTGTVISSKPVFRQNMLHTLTEVSIKSVLKGPFSQGDVIFIDERGGQIVLEEYIRGTRLEPEAMEDISKIDGNTPVVVGIDGYYPMPLGQHVLLFISIPGWKTQEATRNVYTCLGDYDGVFYQQSDKITYIKPLPDASGIHMSLEERCVHGGRLAVTENEISQLDIDE